MSTAAPKPPNPRLNYYQQSPVRGQLEVPDSSAAKTSWRYIQCTDTPNELRVLLPPRTATIYHQLLKVEASELAKDRAANWERILEIRHLKDRMIRKCTRLGRAAVPKDKPAPRVMFQTVHAPPDFRLKEMERWFRMQHPDSVRAPAEGSGAPYCRECQECIAHQAQSSAQAHMHAPAHAPVRRAPSSSRPAPSRGAAPDRMARRAPAPPAQTVTYTHAGGMPPRQDIRTARIPPVSRTHARQASAPSAPGYYPAAPRTAEGRKSADYLRADHGARMHVRSPDPLPIPYRPRDASSPPESASSVLSSEKESPAPQVLDLPIASSPTPMTSPPTSSTPPKIASPPNGLPTIHEDDQFFDHRPIVRRRSSLKKRDSMSRLSIASQSKSVAWAMDRDWTEQMSKYVKTTNEAEVLSEELEKMRIAYHCEVETMRNLCMKVEDTQERIRMESECLRRDQALVRAQESKILANTEQIEQKQQEFLAKVLAALEESRRVVQLCDKKRDMHDSS
ncbi:uncharacterized protein TRAVEDRAFT_62125 [Trametes versicolor FP-101664 SS1]|uniref:uncharacterized protein n=1 Tax=Trametes versicolor (strain FP-101664) TaxID=717944 RepID=UPI0004621D9B|nr:uncharacterized protein TRAVEDRAFT_62125 [Trametes versicolor FP-101664 SS1]EIW64598.1 hypothetical protein TRAVEDRAFT_62125 [Trametes versicolor FP-101664 SS1]